MAVQFLKRSTIPAPVKGKVSSLSVVVNKNGQIQLSKMSHDFIKGNSLVMGFDGSHVCLFPVTAKAVAKVDEKDYVKLNVNKKGSGATFSASYILDHATEYGASHNYPFRQSGNQSFACTENEKLECLIFELPATALTAKPVVKRKPKAKPAAAMVAEVGSTVGVPVTEEELVLA